MDMNGDQSAAFVSGPSQPTTNTSDNGIAHHIQPPVRNSYDSLTAEMGKKHNKKKSKGSHQTPMTPLATDTTSAAQEGGPLSAEDRVDVIDSPLETLATAEGTAMKPEETVTELAVESASGDDALTNVKEVVDSYDKAIVSSDESPVSAAIGTVSYDKEGVVEPSATSRDEIITQAPPLAPDVGDSGKAPEDAEAALTTSVSETVAHDQPKEPAMGPSIPEDAPLEDPNGATATEVADPSMVDVEEAQKALEDQPPSSPEPIDVTPVAVGDFAPTVQPVVTDEAKPELIQEVSQSGNDFSSNQAIVEPQVPDIKPEVPETTIETFKPVEDSVIIEPTETQIEAVPPLIPVKEALAQVEDEAISEIPAPVESAPVLPPAQEDVEVPPVAVLAAAALDSEVDAGLDDGELKANQDEQTKLQAAEEVATGQAELEAREREEQEAATEKQQADEQAAQEEAQRAAEAQRLQELARLEREEQEEFARIEREKLARIEREKQEELARLENEKQEELERLVKEKLERARVEQEELERLEREKHEQEELARLEQEEQEERARLEQEELARLEREKREQEELEAKRVEDARIAAELEAHRIEQEKREQEERETASRIEAERFAAELEAKHIEDERTAAELETKRLEDARIAAEEAKRVEEARIAAELEAHRIEQEKIELERLVTLERERSERLEREKSEALEREKLDALERERLEELARQERIETERLAAEEAQKVEQAALLAAQEEQKAKEAAALLAAQEAEKTQEEALRLAAEREPTVSDEQPIQEADTNSSIDSAPEPLTPVITLENTKIEDISTEFPVIERSVSASPIQRPKSPFPASFQVSTVGRGSTPQGEESDPVPIVAPVPVSAKDGSSPVVRSLTPSYSVHSQGGSPLQVAQGLKQDDTESQVPTERISAIEDGTLFGSFASESLSNTAPVAAKESADPPPSLYVPSYSISRQGSPRPEVQESAVVDSAPSDHVAESAVEAPHRQAPLAKEPAEGGLVDQAIAQAEKAVHDLPKAAENTDTFQQLPEISVSSGPVPSADEQNFTPKADSQLAAPETASAAAAAEREEAKSTLSPLSVQTGRTSGDFTYQSYRHEGLSLSSITNGASPLIIPDLSAGRKRLESSGSGSSKFFPGGWYSAASKIPDESRPSLETASGEFIPSKSPVSPLPAADASGSGRKLPPISTADLDVQPAEGGEQSSTSTSAHRRKWCIIM